MKGEADVTIRMTRHEVAALAVAAQALVPAVALAESQRGPLSDEIIVGSVALIRVLDAALIALGGTATTTYPGLDLRAAAIGAEKRMAARERLGSS